MCSDECRSKTGNVSPCRSVISGQSGVIICQRGFNYKAAKIMLSNKRPLLSSLTSKIVPGDGGGGDEACTSVVLELMIQLEKRRESAGRRRRPSTWHRDGNRKILMVHLTKLQSFMLLYFISQQYYNSYMFFFLGFRWLRRLQSPAAEVLYPVTTRLLRSDEQRKQKRFCSDHLTVGGKPGISNFWNPVWLLDINKTRVLLQWVREEELRN